MPPKKPTAANKTTTDRAATSPVDETTPTAAEMAEETRQAAEGRAAEMKERARSEAARLADEARAAADDRAKDMRDYATSNIDRTAAQMRNAGREFGDDSYQAQAADYLASNLTHAADIIRDKDLASVTDDISTFARRNPAVFLGGAALLGFAAARMLKASDRGGSA